ncbi:MAG: glutamine--fructose-6-phosphate transaminase (isomerizing) [Candidatus Bathyarchaeia archaeon]
MCGIFGAVLKEGEAVKVIHPALRHLEYRGYDSAGIATVSEKGLNVKKDEGKLSDIHRRLNFEDMPGSTGIGHTRWATHGAPSRINAHPHTDCTRRFAAVHNGIIDNFLQLRRELEVKGHIFATRTDTEVIVHLLEEYSKNGASLNEAARETIQRLQGSYSIAFVSTTEPHTTVCARNETPLVIGVGEKGTFVSSDIAALLPVTKNYVEVLNGELVVLSPRDYEIRNKEFSSISRIPKVIDWSVDAAEKQGFEHFMLKEIYEQPQTLRNALHLQEKYLELLAVFLDRSKEIFLLASGTSYNACLAASYMLSKMACLPAHPVLASEFIQQYGDAVNIDSTVFAVSQSGETADVLQAIDHARNKAATVLGLTNTIGSTLTRVSRAYISQQSGPEIGVAATKTFTSQLMVLMQVGLRLAKIRGKVSQDQIDHIQEKLTQIPEIVEVILRRQAEKVQHLAEKFRNVQATYFLGRGLSAATALEGRLKLLEIARVPSLAYPAGESKHGPISLIEPGFPVIFIVPKDGTRRLIASNIQEMAARKAQIISICEEGDEEIMDSSVEYLEIPKGIPELLSPIPYVLPLQLFSYYMAMEKGLDPDKPKNLAKSVTVI